MPGITGKITSFTSPSAPSSQHRYLLGGPVRRQATRHHRQRPHTLRVNWAKSSPDSGGQPESTNPRMGRQAHGLEFGAEPHVRAELAGAGGQDGFKLVLLDVCPVTGVIC
jgi:hypothetical protein